MIACSAAGEISSSETGIRFVDSRSSPVTGTIWPICVPSRANTCEVDVNSYASSPSSDGRSWAHCSAEAPSRAPTLNTAVSTTRSAP
jgi:hypothetical protein